MKQIETEYTFAVISFDITIKYFSNGQMHISTFLTFSNLEDCESVFDLLGDFIVFEPKQNVVELSEVWFFEM